jgi:hypothetical protein
VRSNKRSIYDRGIEPSGNAYQYPFKSSPQRAENERQSVADAATQTTVADSRREAPPRAVPTAVASNTAARRQVILEWRRQDGR